MTGYGRGEASSGGLKLAVELAAVNRKQAEIAVSLPRELEPLESRIRDEINQAVSRGRVTCRVLLEAGEAAPGSRINAAAAKAAADDLRKLAQDLDLPVTITLDHLLRVPGVLQSESTSLDADEVWPTLQKAVKQALKELVAMREREGGHLEQDLRARIDQLQKSVAVVAVQAPEVLARYRQQLRERVAAAGLPLPPEDDERLLKEIVYYSDRSDISEELTRLKSHFAQFDGLVKSAEPVGRTLDFLSQEMNREINTIGSKANDSIISKEVVTLKTELEKFREQSMNIE